METIIAAILLGVLGNAVWFILNAAGNRALKRSQADWRQRQERRHGSQSYGEAFDTPKKAIVYTVGGQAATINFSIAKQKPELIGLICTEQTKGIAESVIQHFDATGKRCKIESCDATDIVDIRDKTRIVFGWLTRQGVNTSDVVLDPTGGMTNMSVGAYSVAEELEIDSQYLRSDFDEHNKRIPGTEKATYISRHSAAPILQPYSSQALLTSSSELPIVVSPAPASQTIPRKQDEATTQHSEVA